MDPLMPDQVCFVAEAPSAHQAGVGFFACVAPFVSVQVRFPTEALPTGCTGILFDPRMTPLVADKVGPMLEALAASSTFVRLLP